MSSCLVRGLATAVLTVSTLAAHADTGVRVKDGWVREMPPGTTNAAAYLMLHNHTDTVRRLIGVSTDAAARVELHTIQNDAGTLRMKHIDGVTVPADGMAMLEPGADHVMLIGVDERLTEGHHIDMTLQFANGESQHVRFAVKRGKPMQHGDSHGHSMPKPHDHSQSGSDS